MPRFFFNVQDAHGALRDREGRELCDVAAARMAALDGARSLISDDVREGKLDLNGRLEVTDAPGGVVLVLRYADAVCLAPHPHG